MPRTANTEIPSSGTPSSAQNSAVRAASWPRVPVVSGPPRMTSTSPPGGSSGRRRVAISLRSRIDPLAFECSRRAASQLADGCNDLFCGKILRNCSSRIVPIAVLFSAPERRYARNEDCSMYPSQPQSRGIGSERCSCHGQGRSPGYNGTVRHASWSVVACKSACQGELTPRAVSARQDSTLGGCAADAERCRLDLLRPTSAVTAFRCSSRWRSPHATIDSLDDAATVRLYE